MLSSLLQVRSRSNASLTAATGGSQTLLIGRNTPTSTPATSPITARYIYIISIHCIYTISTLITGAGLRQVLHPPQQPEEAHEGARKGRDLVRRGQRRGKVRRGLTDTRVPQLGQRYFRNASTMTVSLNKAVTAQ